MVRITVCGYPRSGNVWICRLLGEALDYPVVGIRWGQDSLAAEGKERQGGGIVRQAHLWPGEKGNLHINLKEHTDQIFLHVVRDPRDIAVSMTNFWGYSIDRALNLMIDGPGPLELPSWSTYTGTWLMQKVRTLRYEDFHKNAETEMRAVLEHLQLESSANLSEVVEHQSFRMKRMEIEQRGDEYPFGRTAQLRHLRSGLVGEWRDTLTLSQKQRAQKAWGQRLEELGYAYS